MANNLRLLQREADLELIVKAGGITSKDRLTASK